MTNLRQFGQQLVQEWNDIRNNYPDAKVKNLFPTGYPGYRRSRKQGSYSLDAVKQNLR